MGYHTLMLAGASWVAEFGDPDDPADWAFLEQYSPYYNVRAGRRYPTVLFTTSARADLLALTYGLLWRQLG